MFLLVQKQPQKHPSFKNYKWQALLSSIVRFLGYFPSLAHAIILERSHFRLRSLYIRFKQIFILSIKDSVIFLAM